MKLNRAMKTVMTAVLGILLVSVSDERAHAQAGSAVTIPTGQLMQPTELNQLLSAAGGQKPLVLQVGSKVLFTESHIKGAEYAGPGARDEGLKALRDRVSALPRTSFIVIYCGCCPWSRCPNIAPAYKALTEMGFTHVKALYLENNFGTDWAGKGYAVESGQ